MRWENNSELNANFSIQFKRKGPGKDVDREEIQKRDQEQMLSTPFNEKGSVCVCDETGIGQRKKKTNIGQILPFAYVSALHTLSYSVVTMIVDSFPHSNGL